MENVLKAVLVLLLVLAVAGSTVSGCYRPPKEPNEILRSELKGKAVKAQVERLIDVIDRSGSDKEQRVAVELLAEIGQPAVPALIEKMKDDRTAHRDNYLLALKLIGKPAVGEVINLLDSDKPLVREEAFALLLAIGNDSVPDLLRSLNSGNKNIRPAIINLLATIRDERAVEPLARIFMDAKEDARLRTQALAVLVSIGKPAMSYLAQALNSDDKETREAASMAIEQIDHRGQK